MLSQHLNCEPKLGPVSAEVGIGLKTQHMEEFYFSKPDLDFVEIHAENFLGPGGPHLLFLEKIWEDFYPISIHGVGLSLGGEGPLNKDHLEGLRSLINWIDPFFVSEHLAWSRAGGKYLPDLLPLPYCQATLETFCDHVNKTQDFLGRQILIENPSAYLVFEESIFSEQKFLAKVVQKTGCGLLLDLNNIVVSAFNINFRPSDYLKDFPFEAVKEIHLAGHSLSEKGGKKYKIDDHGSVVSQEVWNLFDFVIEKIGPVPTLVEWDNNLPNLPVLVSEAMMAKRKIKKIHRLKKEI